MHSDKISGSKPGPSTQRYLDIAEIKEDVVVLRDGTLRVVLLVSSINFALKSEDEQQAIIQQYVQFLNTLDFPLQIVIQSRQLNIDDYLMRLQESEKNQPNQLLKNQVADYREFIKELITLGEIMQKQFFVVVPFNPLSDKRKTFWERLTDMFLPAFSLRLADKIFRERREALMFRVGHIMSSLGSMSLNAVVLDTQSLIELYYRVYNPEQYETQKMVTADKLQLTELPGSNT